MHTPHAYNRVKIRSNSLRESIEKIGFGRRKSLVHDNGLHCRENVVLVIQRVYVRNIPGIEYVV